MNLEWGLKDVIPDDAVAAWGARAILSYGRFDAPSDRRSFMREDDDMDSRDAFVVWMGETAWAWLTEKAKRITGNENLTHALDEGRFHIRCNAQASYGYLYVSAWMDPS